MNLVTASEIKNQFAVIERLRMPEQQVIDRHGRIQFRQPFHQNTSNFLPELADRVGATLAQGAQVLGLKR